MGNFTNSIINVDAVVGDDEIMLPRHDKHLTS